MTAAVTGTGFIGPVHVEALRRLGVRVKGILGSSPAKSERAAGTLGLPKAYASYDEILADPEVHVVHITTPNRRHRDMVIGALEAGKHVGCEKPLATSSAETSELVERARTNPALVTAVNYNVRFYPLALQARDLVRNRRDWSRVKRKGRLRTGLAADRHGLEPAIARGGGGANCERWGTSVPIGWI